MKIITVIGARPQFIKASIVSKRFLEHGIEELLIHTGQHFDDNMSEIFFTEMGIPKPAYHLDCGGLKHGAMTGRLIEKIEEILLREKPDCVLVYGDTNSTLAGAIAASKLHVPVAHVEAGLRSYNRDMPEEINRIVADHVSSLLFCPTEHAVQTLYKEGIDPKSMVVENVGDVMLDVAEFFRQRAKPSLKLQGLLDQFPKFYLCTIHRAENTDDIEILSRILSALDMIAMQTPIVFPIHPRTKKILQENRLQPPHIVFTEPVGYMDMICLLDGCKGVFSDSGGLQKEAFFFQKPCIILREETEWIELVERGYNILAGSSIERISSAEKHIRNKSQIPRDAIFGDGQASTRIISSIKRFIDK